MSDETKRDVVLQIAKENRDLRMYDPEAIEPKELIEQDYQDWIHEYDAALPDDLPVIPKAVGDYIIEEKAKGATISDVFWRCVFDHGEVENWISVNEHDEIVSLAWVLGVWRVEETGEIVKLEEEK